MIESVSFRNFRALRNADLKLGRCNLLLGPNGSGKSTAINALWLIADEAKRGFAGPGLFGNQNASGLTERHRSFGTSSDARIEIIVNTKIEDTSFSIEFSRPPTQIIQPNPSSGIFSTVPSGTKARQDCVRWLSGIRVFSLDPLRIAAPARLQPAAEIGSDGSNLSVALTQLQDKSPERFESLNEELARWLPEFDRVLFDTGINGERILMLRTKVGRHSIAADDLSHGVLLSFCIMSLSHLTDPPTMVCLEEPDRGIHPRLLRQVHDAMVRLSNPEQFGDKRKAVQVIATTHSPYLLELFHDHPEDVVLAEKEDHAATFHRLTDMPHYEEIMHDGLLSDAWYSGILGGVPASP